MKCWWQLDNYLFSLPYKQDLALSFKTKAGRVCFFSGFFLFVCFWFFVLNRFMSERSNEYSDAWQINQTLSFSQRFMVINSGQLPFH